MSYLKLPSAWIPLAMSSLAVAVVIAHIGMYGVAREADEGAATHVWQALMILQIPIVAYFAYRWLPGHLKQGLQVLMLQVCAAIAALAPLYLLGL